MSLINDFKKHIKFQAPSLKYTIEDNTMDKGFIIVTFHIATEGYKHDYRVVIDKHIISSLGYLRSILWRGIYVFAKKHYPAYRGFAPEYRTRLFIDITAK